MSETQSAPLGAQKGCLCLGERRRGHALCVKCEDYDDVINLGLPAEEEAEALSEIEDEIEEELDGSLTTEDNEPI